MEAKFLLYYSYLCCNELTDCSMGLTNYYYEIKSLFEKGELDYRYFRVLYYLADCYFKMEKYDLALSYLEQLWDICSERLINKEK